MIRQDRRDVICVVDYGGAGKEIDFAGMMGMRC